MTVPVAERGSARQRSQGIGRAAVLIGTITLLARVIGFGRQVVFAHTVQALCLGTAYTTANMVPNIIYDVVLGGALTAVIERTSALRRLDMLGRRPASPAPLITIPVQPAAGEHHGGHRDGQRQDTTGPAGSPHAGGPAESTDAGPPRE